ncbi:MAG TPA: VWA domain-containing protein [Bryobacteraceae bacterium]|nr:VWA domain-containing protein [Bryobacteraceae bacterium]
MNFVHPWALPLVLLPLGWVAYAWSDTARRSTLLLKALSFCAIAIALAEPTLTLPETKTGLVVLVDTSKSVTAEDLSHASSLARRIESGRHGNWVKIVPFAAAVRDLDKEEVQRGVHFLPASNDLGNATNFEAALTSSMSAVPAGYIPRLVLISDGNENQGSSARAIAELERLHVPVDTIPLTGRSGVALRLESLSMPRIAYAGEQIPIDVTVNSPARTSSTVEIAAEGKLLGRTAVELETGVNRLRVHARVKTSGVTSLSGRIGEARFEQAIELRRAKVLYLSQDPAGTESNLLKAFGQAEFEIVRDASLLDNDLASVQLVVVNNLDLNNLSLARKKHLESYTKNGGGLLLIGGERQLYKDDQRMDALDQALPAKLAPPKTPEGTAVALIIDKSSSMEGRKIELARLSAIGVIDHLRPVDTIGVLIFDNSFQWAVPMRHAEDKSLIKRLVSGITPDGGTQIAPALTEAYRKVSLSKGTYKHIVLLTDGISEEGDSIELAKDAAEHQVTISTVGLGQDVNRSYLEKVAATSGGRSYFLNEPQGLEQILLKDVQDFSGSTAIERSLTPIVERKAEVLEGVGMESAPALKGYARFVAKPGAETILSVNQDKKDPLYTRWQYGLGRAAVFASDAKSRWAAAWIAWPGFDKFWINVARDLLTHTDLSEASAHFDSANGDILVSYQLARDLPEPTEIPPIFAIGPNGFEKRIPIAKSTARSYRGRLHIGQLSGLFRIRPLRDSNAFPEIGLYREQNELRDYGANTKLLAQISALTGGRFNPPADSLFEARGSAVYVTWQLWPTLLGVAIALTIAELVARKWSGLAQAWRRG